MKTIALPKFRLTKSEVKTNVIAALIFTLLTTSLTGDSSYQPSITTMLAENTAQFYKLEEEITDSFLIPQKQAAHESVVPPSDQKDEAWKIKFRNATLVKWGNRSKTELALTFDDGYDRISVQRVLNTLKKTGTKCTFFVVGDAIRKYPDLWKQAAEEGHQICNHTSTHKFLKNVPEETVKREIEGWETAVKDALGEDYLKKMKKDFPFFRFPGGLGDSSEENLKTVSGLGYIPIGWSDETVYSVLRLHKLGKEPVEPIAGEIVSHVVGNAKNGAIILLHFNAYDTSKLEETVKQIGDKGFKLRTLSELLADGQ